MKKFILLAFFGLICADLQASQPEEGLRRRATVYGPPQRNMGPVPDLAQYDRPEGQHFECDGSSFFQSLADNMSSFFGNVHNFFLWPNDNEAEERPIPQNLVRPDQICWQMNYEPAVVIEDKPINISMDDFEFGITPDVPDDLELLGPKERPTFVQQELTFADYLARRPSAQNVVNAINSPEKCQAAFEYLNDLTEVKVLNFNQSQPFVLPAFVKFWYTHKDSFKSLRAIMCSGHQLTPHETYVLLKFMSAVKPSGFIDLTPVQKGVDHPLLVALAARVTSICPELRVAITGAILPYGIEGLTLPENLKLTLCQTKVHDKDQKIITYMRQIIQEDKVTINYGDGKKLVLDKNEPSGK